jgi:hypothetical protein
MGGRAFKTDWVNLANHKGKPMAKPTKSLEERLQGHPELRERLLRLLELAESGIDSADEVEVLAVEGSQGLERQVMQDWA